VITIDTFTNLAPIRDLVMMEVDGQKQVLNKKILSNFHY
jgi:hypothetical protein